MWVWSALFATSWATYVPFGDSTFDASYTAYLMIWIVIQGVWGSLSLTEQSEIQMVMFILRIVLFVLVLVTVLIPWAADINAFNLGDKNASYTPSTFEQFQPKNFYIPLAVLSFCCQIAGAVTPVVGALADKSHASTVVRSAAIVSFTCYASFGIFLSLYFSNFIEVPFSTLWNTFSGFTDQGISTPLYAAAMAGFVIIFPSFDVMSSYAMQSQFVCDSTLYLLLGSAGTDSLKSDHQWAYFACRLLTSVLPPLCALITNNLGLLVVYTGPIFLILQYVYPSYLAYTSKRRMRELNKPYVTEFTMPYSDALSIFMFVVGIASSIVLVASLSIAGVPRELL